MGCPTVFASRMSAAEIECRSVMMLTRSECRKNDEDRSGGWRVEDLRRGEKCIKAKVSMKVVMARNANASDLNTRESICQFGFPLARVCSRQKGSVCVCCSAVLCCAVACVSQFELKRSAPAAREKFQAQPVSRYRSLSLRVEIEALANSRSNRQGPLFAPFLCFGNSTRSAGERPKSRNLPPCSHRNFPTSKLYSSLSLSQRAG